MGRGGRHCHPDILQRKDTATLTLRDRGTSTESGDPMACPQDLGEDEGGQGGKHLISQD